MSCLVRTATRSAVPAGWDCLDRPHQLAGWILGIGEHGEPCRRGRRSCRNLGQSCRNSGLLRDLCRCARGDDLDVGQIHSADKCRRKTRERLGSLRFTSLRFTSGRFATHGIAAAAHGCGHGQRHSQYPDSLLDPGRLCDESLRGRVIFPLSILSFPPQYGQAESQVRYELLPPVPGSETLSHEGPEPPGPPVWFTPYIRVQDPPEPAGEST
jgi:hypothetical protein